MQVELFKNAYLYDWDDIEYILGYFAEPKEKSIRETATAQLIADGEFEFVRDNNVYLIKILSD